MPSRPAARGTAHQVPSRPRHLICSAQPQLQLSYRAHACEDGRREALAPGWLRLVLSPLLTRRAQCWPVLAPALLSAPCSMPRHVGTRNNLGAALLLASCPARCSPPSPCLPCPPSSCDSTASILPSSNADRCWCWRREPAPSSSSPPGPASLAACRVSRAASASACSFSMASATKSAAVSSMPRLWATQPLLSLTAASPNVPCTL